MLDVSIYGRLGADAEVVEWKNGKFIQFRVAVDDYVNGQRTTTWVRVTTDFNEKRLEWLKKGKMVQVKGTLSINLYTAKDGSTKVSIDIRAYSYEPIKIGSGNTDASSAEVSTGTLKKEAVATVPNVEVSTTNTTDDLPF